MAGRQRAFRQEARVLDQGPVNLSPCRLEHRQAQGLQERGPKGGRHWRHEKLRSFHQL